MKGSASEYADVIPQHCPGPLIQLELSCSVCVSVCLSADVFIVWNTELCLI